MLTGQLPISSVIAGVVPQWNSRRTIPLDPNDITPIRNGNPNEGEINRIYQCSVIGEH